MTELANLDERKVARGVAIGLPVTTFVAAMVTGQILGPSMAILVLGAGVLLGVVAILWASIRVLTGDAPLPPEIEALEQKSEAVDQLATQKKMMILGLKDLENEHAIGKLDDEDFAHISQTYRANLKAVLKEIDAQLEPFRAKAEAEAKLHLAKAGRPKPVVAEEDDDDDAAEAPVVVKKKERVTCPKCEESNEPDAKFCKGCATSLVVSDEV